MSRCEGFGYIQAECTNTLKRNKALTASWSDDETIDEQESVEEYEDLIALTSLIESTLGGLHLTQRFSTTITGEYNDTPPTNDKAIFDEELTKTCTGLYNKLVESVKENRRPTLLLSEVKREKGDLLEELKSLWFTPAKYEDRASGFYQKHGQNLGNVNSSGIKSLRRQQGKKVVICYHCKRLGHIKRN